MIELLQLAHPHSGLHVADLQIIADMAVGIFVVVALRQIAEAPAEPFVAGIVQPRLAVAIPTPIAK